MDTCTLSLQLSPTNQKLPVEVKFDNEIIWQGYVAGHLTINHQFYDTEGDQHKLSITMSEKTPEHTILNASGKIIEDSCIEISEFKLDNIELNYTFYENCVYSHDFNGTGNSVKESFFRTMGCNGTVTFSFSSPVYLWLLENI